MKANVTMDEVPEQEFLIPPEYDPFEPCPECFQPGPASRWWDDDE